MKELLRNRDLVLLVLGRSGSALGDAMAIGALLLATAHAGGSTREVAPILLAFAVPLIALAGPAGRLVDRADSHRLLVAGGAVQVLASGALVVATALPTRILAILALQSAVAVTSPAWAALLPRTVPDERVPAAISVQQTGWAVGNLLGAAAAGLSFDHLGYAATMAVDTLSFAVLVLVAALIRTRRIPQPTSAAAGEHRGGGMGFLVREPVLVRVFGAALVFIVVAEGLNVIEVFLITGSLGASATAYGLVGLAAGLGALAGPALAARPGTDAARVLGVAAGFAGMGIALVLAGLAPAWGYAALAYAVLGVANGAANALTHILLIGRTPEQLRGRVISLVNGGSRGASVLALALGGWLGTLWGPRTLYVAGGALAVLVALTVLLARRPALQPAGAAYPRVPGTHGAVVPQGLD